MPDKIKIFVDAHCMDTEYQGTHTFLRGLYSEMLKFPDLDIYFGTADARKINDFFPEVKKQNILTYKSSIVPGYRLLADIPSMVKRYQFSFAHFQNIAPLKSSRCKYIVTLHDVLYNDFAEYFPFLYRNTRNLVFRKCINEASIKTTVSAYSRQRISYHYNTIPSQLHVLPNAATCPINPDKQSAKQLIASEYGLTNFILCVGRIEPRKNQQLLLRNYLQLKLYEQNIPLVFIGKHSLRSDGFESMIKGLSNEQKKSVHWFEQVDEEILHAFYAACKTFVYPSIAEGFGIPPIEAAMHEVPVLCANSSAMSDFDFFSESNFDPLDEEAFKIKLAMILNAPPSKQHLEMIAKAVKDRYSWKRSAQQLYDLIKNQN